MRLIVHGQHCAVLFPRSDSGGEGGFLNSFYACGSRWWNYSNCCGEQAMTMITGKWETSWMEKQSPHHYGSSCTTRSAIKFPEPSAISGPCSFPSWNASNSTGNLAAWSYLDTPSIMPQRRQMTLAQATLSKSKLPLAYGLSSVQSRVHLELKPLPPLL